MQAIEPSPHPEVRLSRDLRLLDVTMIGVGAMIGAGIFVLTGLAAGQAGPALLLVFLLNGIVTTATALSYAELGSCFPEAGGGYLWVKEGLPGPNGFLSGWMSWFAHAVACSLYALGFGAYFGETLAEMNLSLFGLSPPLAAKLLAVVICLLFTWINFWGASETGKAETVVTVGKVVILGLFVLSGLGIILQRPDPMEHFTPFMPNGWGGVLVAMALTFIAFEGYEIIAQSGEEVKNPRRNIPRAIFISLAVVIVIYILVAFVALAAVRLPSEVAGMQTWQYLGQEKELAMVQAARNFMLGGGRWGAVIFLIGGIFSTMSALNATIYSSSRVSFAMGRDHNLPPVFARVHRSRHTPHGALFISSALIILMAVSLPIEDVASACDIMFLLLFLQVNLALITLRRRRPDLPRGFRVPLVPLVPLLGVGCNLVLAVVLFSYSPISWYITAVWIAAGLAVFYGYSRRQEREAVASRVVQERTPITRRRYRVLVPVANPEHVAHLIHLAAAVAREHDGEVIVLSVTAVPEMLPLEAGRRLLPRSEQALALAERAARQRGVDVTTIARIGHSVHRAILETIEEERPAMVVLGWRGWTQTSQRVLGTTLDPVLRHAPCHVALLKAMGDLTGELRTLVGVTASPHSDLAVEVGYALKLHGGARVSHLHVVKEGTPMDPRVEREYRQVLKGERGREEVPELKVTRDTSTAVGLVRAAQEGGYDLVILGAAREGPLRQLLYGTKALTVAKLSQASVLLVKHAPPRWMAMLQDMVTPIQDGRQVEVPEEEEEGAEEGGE